MAKRSNAFFIFCLFTALGLFTEYSLQAAPLPPTGSADYVDPEYVIRPIAKRVHFDWDQKKYWFTDFEEIIGLSTQFFGKSWDRGTIEFYVVNDQIGILLKRESNDGTQDPVGFYILESNGDLSALMSEWAFGFTRKLVQRAPLAAAPPIDAQSIIGTWKYENEGACDGCVMEISSLTEPMRVSGGYYANSPAFFNLKMGYVGTPLRGTRTIQYKTDGYFFFLTKDYALDANEFQSLVRVAP